MLLDLILTLRLLELVSLVPFILEMVTANDGCRPAWTKAIPTWQSGIRSEGSKDRCFIKVIIIMYCVLVGDDVKYPCFVGSFEECQDYLSTYTSNDCTYELAEYTEDIVEAVKKDLELV